eukprot:gene5174-18398_t
MRIARVYRQLHQGTRSSLTEGTRHEDRRETPSLQLNEEFRFDPSEILKSELLVLKRKDYSPSYEARFVVVHGLRLHYIDEQKTGGQEAEGAILLVHGQLSWSYLYRRVVPLLVAAGHRVVALDLPGFGFSDKLAKGSDLTPQLQMSTLRIFMDKVGLTQNVTLVLEGEAAQWMLLGGCELQNSPLCGVVLLDPQPWSGKPSFEETKEWCLQSIFDYVLGSKHGAAVALKLRSPSMSMSVGDTYLAQLGSYREGDSDKSVLLPPMPSPLQPATLKMLRQSLSFVAQLTNRVEEFGENSFISHYGDPLPPVVIRSSSFCSSLGEGSEEPESNANERKIPPAPVKPASNHCQQHQLRRQTFPECTPNYSILSSPNCTLTSVLLDASSSHQGVTTPPPSLPPPSTLYQMDYSPARSPPNGSTTATSRGRRSTDVANPRCAAHSGLDRQYSGSSLEDECTNVTSPQHGCAALGLDRQYSGSSLESMIQPLIMSPLDPVSVQSPELPLDMH